jgi:threonylcarbamoyladenosine tRNA methylthiotransferase MtaB
MTDEIRQVRVALPTLGCKVNRYDSDTLARELRRRGYSIVPASQPADAYIVNTCTVTADAGAKSRKMLRKALKLTPGAVMIVTGCYAALEHDEVEEMDGVTAVVPQERQAEIPDLLEKLLPPMGNDDGGILSGSINRTRAVVKVQDGCDRQCAYCAVTIARGDLRSRPIVEIIDELKEILARGVMEIVLTGIRLDAYGMDGDEYRLADLIKATIPLNIPRLRLSSLEPIGIDDELITTLANHPTLCRHFHMCLQSGDDEILAKMRRGYDAAFFTNMVNKIKATMPDATFSTDVIVGFPGENDAAFFNTFKLIQEIGFINLHVFRFSPRPHTEAEKMKHQVQDSVKETRSAYLHDLEKRLFAKSAEKLIGTVQPILVERGGTGLTPGGHRVAADFNMKDLNKILPVLIESVEDMTMSGVKKSEE